MHFPDRDWDESKSIDICGQETNYSILVKNRDVDVQAWGFNNHRHDGEFRRNNGTKFLIRFKALSEEETTGNVWICVFLLDFSLKKSQRAHVLNKLVVFS